MLKECESFPLYDAWLKVPEKRVGALKAENLALKAGLARLEQRITAREGQDDPAGSVKNRIVIHLRTHFFI